MSNIYLSVIVPFFNEEMNLSRFHRELITVLLGIQKKSQIVYVNDGSTDNSITNLKSAIGKINHKNIIIKIISLRRNFGQTAAISSGIDQASGQVLAFMDADLQIDPRDIPGMLNKLNEGYDAVVGWRRSRQDDFLRVLLSKIANSFISAIFKLPFHDIGCSLKVIKKECLNDIRIYGETHRLMVVLLYWRGISIVERVVNHRRRVSGKSKYGYSRIIKLILDLITAKFLNSYGTKPSYIFGAFGIVSIFFSIVLMLVVLYHKFFQSVFVHRNPLFLIASFLIMIGIQFILMGLLAELIVRTYFESQKKSIYEVKNITNY